MAFDFPSAPSVGQIYTSNGATFIWDGTKWKTVAVNQSAMGVGQCYFQIVSGSVCRLLPFNGNRITIGGVDRTIPSAGVDIAPTGLTVGAVYFVYAYWTGTAIALEVSATTYVLDTGTGLMVKTGDASRTLVGKVYITTGPAFIDSGVINGVASWFNRRRKQFVANVSGTTTSTTPSIIPNTTIYAFPWIGSVYECFSIGAIANTLAQNYAYTAINWNGNRSVAHYYLTGGASWAGVHALRVVVGAGSESLHTNYMELWGNAGTASISGGHYVLVEN